MLLKKFINVSLVLLISVTTAKYELSKPGHTMVLTEGDHVEQFSVGLGNFPVQEQPLDGEISEGKDLSVYKIGLNFQKQGILFKKNKKSKKENNIKIVKGDYVRFVDPNSTLDLGITVPLSPNLSFKDLLSNMNHDRNLVPISRYISLTEYTHDDVNIWNLYEEFTSNKKVVEAIKEDEGIEDSDPALILRSTKRLDQAITGAPSLIIGLNLNIANYIVTNYVYPLFLKKMDPEDRNNQALMELFKTFKEDLSLPIDFFYDYELMLNADSFSKLINEFLIQGQSINFAIDSMMEAVMGSHNKLDIEFPPENFDINTDSTDKYDNSISFILFSMAGNFHKYYKKKHRVPMNKKVLDIVRAGSKKFAQGIKSLFKDTKYASPFDHSCELLVPVIMTNFGPELIEMYFWLSQTNFYNFILKYIIFTNKRAKFHEFFVMGNKLSRDSVMNVGKYFQPEKYAGLKVKKYYPIFWTKDRLV
jgi:hypothetical protein